MERLTAGPASATVRQANGPQGKSRAMKRKGLIMDRTKQLKGFTLVELMIVVGILAILVALALPSYTRYIRKANRTEGQQLMMQYANNQEIWRANDSNYATSAELAVPTHDRYTFFIRATAGSPPAAADCANTNPTATTYTVVACATGDQIKDEDQGQSCTRLGLTQANLKSPAECW